MPLNTQLNQYRLFLREACKPSLGEPHGRSDDMSLIGPSCLQKGMTPPKGMVESLSIAMIRFSRLSGPHHGQPEGVFSLDDCWTCDLLFLLVPQIHGAYWAPECPRLAINPLRFPQAPQRIDVLMGSSKVVSTLNITSLPQGVFQDSVPNLGPHCVPFGIYPSIVPSRGSGNPAISSGLPTNNPIGTRECENPNPVPRSVQLHPAMRRFQPIESLAMFERGGPSLQDLLTISSGGFRTEDQSARYASVARAGRALDL